MGSWWESLRIWVCGQAPEPCAERHAYCLTRAGMLVACLGVRLGSAPPRPWRSRVASLSGNPPSSERRSRSRGAAGSARCRGLVHSLGFREGGALSPGPASGTSSRGSTWWSRIRRLLHGGGMAKPGDVRLRAWRAIVGTPKLGGGEYGRSIHGDHTTTPQVE